MKINETWFKKSENTLFVVATPFQVLCAYEAIQEFNIKEYSIVAFFLENDPQTEQMLATLDFFKLKYQKFILYKHALIHELIKPRNLFGRRIMRKAKRAFIGDFRNLVSIILAFGFLDRKSSIVYLDDGNVSIVHLKGEYKFSRKDCFFVFILKIIAFFRGISLKPVYYTIYSDVPSQIPCKENNFNFLRKNILPHERKGAYFIGTNPISYCSGYKISIEQYFVLLNHALKNFRIRYAELPLYYVFHRRDQYTDETSLVLKKNGYNALKLNETVEMYFVKNGIIPVAVTGFMSSALYNIKKICSNTYVESFMIEGDEEYAIICEYYKNHGIEIKMLNNEILFTD